MSAELRATMGVKLYDRVLEELAKDMEVSLMEAVDGRGLDKLDKARATALGLTQAMLVAQAIEGLSDIGEAIKDAAHAVSDIGPLVSTAIDNVSERLS